MSVLGTVGIADKGIYNAGTTYTTGNFVLYQGSTWLALKDNLTGIEPEEGENWKYLARGFGSDTLSQILGTDTSGVLGTAGEDVVSQLLIDAIADKVMTKLLPIANLVNNGLTTQAGFALDARYGKTLKDLYDALNSNLGALVPVSSAIADCNDLAKTYGVSILRWDADTLNTPYKQGLYGTSQGFLLDFSIDVLYRTQVAIGAGSKVISIRTGVPYEWSNWTALATVS